MIQIKINNEDKTSLFREVSADNNLNSDPNTCQLEYKKYGSITFIPEGGDDVGIWDGATKIFGGVITKIERKLDSVSSEIFSIEAKDYSELLDRKIVFETFENETVDYIIDFLITNYTSGFTQNNVDCSIEIKKIILNGQPVSKCIDDLAELVGYNWYVAPNKDIHFLARGIETSPFDLTDTNGKYNLQSLEIGYDWQSIVNSVIIEGGKFKGSAYKKHTIKVFEMQGADFLRSDEVRLEYPTTIEFAEMPKITKNPGTDNETELTVGVDNLDSPDSFDVLWNFNEKLIRFSDDTKPDLFDVFLLEGYELIPIKLKASDQDSINEYGENQILKIDKSLSTPSQAIQLSGALMDAYKDKLIEGSFKTLESGFFAGQKINLQSDIRDIDQDFYIKSVKFIMRTPEKFEYEVSLITEKTATLVDFLQKQLLDKVKELDLVEEAVITKYAQKNEAFKTEEVITKDIGNGVNEPIPDYVFGPYWPTDEWPTNKKRQIVWSDNFKFVA